MFPFFTYLGQHDEPLVVSQVESFVVSLPVETRAGQQDSFSTDSAGLLVILNPITPIAATRMTIKIIRLNVFFLGVQQLPSQSQF
jgi:hypothetical protein